MKLDSLAEENNAFVSCVEEALEGSQCEAVKVAGIRELGSQVGPIDLLKTHPARMRLFDSQGRARAQTWQSIGLVVSVAPAIMNGSFMIVFETETASGSPAIIFEWEAIVSLMDKVISVPATVFFWGQRRLSTFLYCRMATD